MQDNLWGFLIIILVMAQGPYSIENSSLYKFRHVNT